MCIRDRPRIRCSDDVVEDLRRMDVKVYTERAVGRRHWGRLLAHVGCSATEDEEFEARLR